MKIFAVSDLHLSINNPKPMDIFGGKWRNYEQKLQENWQNTVSDDDTVIINGEIFTGTVFSPTESGTYVIRFKNSLTGEVTEAKLISLNIDIPAPNLLEDMLQFVKDNAIYFIIGAAILILLIILAATLKRKRKTR